VPTFATTPRFRRDLKALSAEQRARFEKTVREEFGPDVDALRWRPGLRVKRVQGVPKVFEMTWVPDGRAPWEFGAPIRDVLQHVIWRRIGTHDIFTDTCIVRGTTSSTWGRPSRAASSRAGEHWGDTAVITVCVP